MLYLWGMNNEQNTNDMKNATTTAQDILNAGRQQRINDHRQFLAQLEQKENKTRIDQINIMVTKEVLTMLESATA